MDRKSTILIHKTSLGSSGKSNCNNKIPNGYQFLDHKKKNHPRQSPRKYSLDANGVLFFMLWILVTMANLNLSFSADHGTGDKSDHFRLNNQNVEKIMPTDDGKKEENERQRSSDSVRNTVTNEPKFLFGIASAFADDMERRKRELIRKSYLSFYKYNAHFVDNPDLICSLVDILERKVDFDKCQLIYTFFMGGNPNASSELMLGAKSSSNAYLADLESIPDAERDVTYLNIKENQFDGKMQTWFAYASSLINEGLSFDYVAKADSDTLLYPTMFLETANRKLPANPTGVYSGVSVSRTHCGRDTDEHCNKMINNYYMGGALEIVSCDLAHHIASLPYDQRRKLEVTVHEDITIGNFVLSHPKQVQRVELGIPNGEEIRGSRLLMPWLWKHDGAMSTKRPGKWLKLWFDYERKVRRENRSEKSILLVEVSTLSRLFERSILRSCCGYRHVTRMESCVNKFGYHPELYLSKLTQNILDLVPLNLSEAEMSARAWNYTIVVLVQNPIVQILNSVSPTESYNDTSTAWDRNGKALAQLQASSNSTIYIVRVEQAWEDTLSLERSLGNPYAHDILASQLDPVSTITLRMEANVKAGVDRVPFPLCCKLRNEIRAYRELLLYGENLKHPESKLKESMESPFRMCGVQDSLELEKKCEP